MSLPERVSTRGRTMVGLLASWGGLRSLRFELGIPRGARAKDHATLAVNLRLPIADESDHGRDRVRRLHTGAGASADPDRADSAFEVDRTFGIGSVTKCYPIADSLVGGEHDNVAVGGVCLQLDKLAGGKWIPVKSSMLSRINCRIVELRYRLTRFGRATVRPGTARHDHHQNGHRTQRQNYSSHGLSALSGGGHRLIRSSASRTDWFTNRVGLMFNLFAARLTSGWKSLSTRIGGIGSPSLAAELAFLPMCRLCPAVRVRQ